VIALSGVAARASTGGGPGIGSGQVSRSLLSTSGAEIAFGLLGLVVLGSALLVVTVRNLVHAALWLVVALGALAGCYLVLGAELVAWVQVLIYVGAVVVLLLFGLMLTKAPIGRSFDLDSGNRWAAALVAVGTAGLLVTVVVDAFRDTWFAPEAAARQGNDGAVGHALFAYWVLPFEALSVLLLAALVGAVVLSRADVGEAAPSGADQDTTADAVAGSVAGHVTGSEVGPEAGH
jgi:NADH-quinone oxidoreductase subunit J